MKKFKSDELIDSLQADVKQLIAAAEQMKEMDRVKLGYPLAPLVLALVLGDMAESSFRQAMLLSRGSLSIFWANPLVGGLITLALLRRFWPLFSSLSARCGGSRRAHMGPGQ